MGPEKDGQPTPRTKYSLTDRLYVAVLSITRNDLYKPDARPATSQDSDSAGTSAGTGNPEPQTPSRTQRQAAVQHFKASCRADLEAYERGAPLPLRDPRTKTTVVGGAGATFALGLAAALVMRRVRGHAALERRSMGEQIGGGWRAAQAGSVSTASDGPAAASFYQMAGGEGGARVRALVAREVWLRGAFREEVQTRRSGASLLSGR